MPHFTIEISSYIGVLDVMFAFEMLVRWLKFLNYDFIHDGSPEQNDMKEDFIDYVLDKCSEEAVERVNDNMEFPKILNELNGEFMSCSDEYMEKVQFEQFEKKYTVLFA